MGKTYGYVRVSSADQNADRQLIAMGEQGIPQRQAEGIAAARLRGVHLGRPRLSMPEDFAELAACWQAGHISTTELAARCGASESTMYNRLRELGVTRPTGQSPPGEQPSRA